MNSSAGPTGSRVLLVHGIWNARAWLMPMAMRLRQAGLQVEIFGYPTAWGGPAHATARLRERLQRGDVDAVIGHSLGGLMALETMRQGPDLAVARLVCLGSPLCGSATARAFHARPLTRAVLGPHAALLMQGCSRWEGATEIGMVAGNVPHGVGRLLAGLDEASDGTVSLAETRLPGLTDHCVVGASHTGLVFSAAVARQVVEFVRHGRFRH